MKRAVAAAAALAVVIAPLVASEYWVTFATSVAIGALAVVGLSLVVGHAGLLDLGHAAYFGLGAYVTVIWARDGHRPVVVGALLGVVAAGIAGLAVGLVVSRLSGLAVALATLAVALLAQSLAGGLEVTGRNLGTTGPTRLLWGSEPVTPVEIYLGVVVLLAAATGAVWRLRRSRVGRALALVRGAPDAASASGVAIVALRVQVFVVGAAVSGLAGAAFAVSLRFVDPMSIGLPRSIEFLTIGIVGGAASPLGPAMGATFVRALPEVFAPVAEYESLLAGVAFLVVLRWFGGGLAAAVERRLAPNPVLPPEAEPVHGPPAAPGERVWAAARRDDAPTDPTALLSASDIVVDFGGIRALDGVSIEVARAEMHGLIGPNGSGKSTLLDVITGFAVPDHGDVVWQGASLAGRPPHHRARLGLARTFQHGGSAPQLTIRGNVMVGAHAWTRAGLLRAVGPTPREERSVAERTDEVIDLLGLGPFAHLRPERVPAGARRLAEVGRCLAARPQLIVLDEPVAGLDDEETNRLMVALTGLRHDGVAVLLVEHDLELVAAACDTVTVLDAGSVVDVDGSAAR